MSDRAVLCQKDPPLALENRFGKIPAGSLKYIPYPLTNHPDFYMFVNFPVVFTIHPFLAGPSFAERTFIHFGQINTVGSEQEK